MIGYVCDHGDDGGFAVGPFFENARKIDGEQLMKDQSVLEGICGLVWVVDGRVNRSHMAMVERWSVMVSPAHVAFIIRPGCRNYSKFTMESLKDLMLEEYRNSIVVDCLVVDQNQDQQVVHDFLESFGRKVLSAGTTVCTCNKVLPALKCSETRSQFVYEMCARPLISSMVEKAKEDGTISLDSFKNDLERRVQALMDEHHLDARLWNVPSIVQKCGFEVECFRKSEQFAMENEQLEDHLFAQGVIGRMERGEISSSEDWWADRPGCIPTVLKYMLERRWVAFLEMEMKAVDRRATVRSMVRIFLDGIWREGRSIAPDLTAADIVAIFRKTTPTAIHPDVDFNAMEKEVGEALVSARSQVLKSWVTEGHESSCPPWVRVLPLIALSLVIGVGAGHLAGMAMAKCGVAATGLAGGALKGALVGGMSHVGTSLATGSDMSWNGFIRSVATGGIHGAGSFAVGSADLSSMGRLATEGFVGATSAAVGGRDPLHGAVYSMVGEEVASNISSHPVASGAASAVAAVICQDPNPEIAFIHGAAVSACNHAMHPRAPVDAKIKDGDYGMVLPDGSEYPTHYAPTLDDDHDCLKAKVEANKNLEILERNPKNSLLSHRRARAGFEEKTVEKMQIVAGSCRRDGTVILKDRPLSIDDQMQPSISLAMTGILKMIDDKRPHEKQHMYGFHDKARKFDILTNDPTPCASMKLQSNIAIDRAVARGEPHPSPDADVMLRIIEKCPSTGVLAIRHDDNIRDVFHRATVSNMEIMQPLIESFVPKPERFVPPPSLIEPLNEK